MWPVPRLKLDRDFQKKIALCDIVCACACVRVCVCDREREDTMLSPCTLNHTLITTEPVEVWWDRNMSWLTLGCHTSTWSIHSLTPHFKYLYTSSVLFSRPNWTPSVPLRLHWGSLDTSTVLDLSRCSCTCLHLSSAPFLSPSACSARSMAFSLSNFSICIFFLMASMVPPRVLSPQQGYPDRDGGRCGLEHT